MKQFNTSLLGGLLILASTSLGSLGCSAESTPEANDGPSSTDQAALSCGFLRADENMIRGTTLLSCNGAAALYFQPDGNLVWENRARGRNMWAASTDGKGPSMLRMQLNGDLVVFHYDGATPIWHSGTGGNPGAYLRLQDNGNLVVYSADGSRNLWSTETVIRANSTCSLAYSKYTSVSSTGGGACHKNGPVQSFNQSVSWSDSPESCSNWCAGVNVGGACSAFISCSASYNP